MWRVAVLVCACMVNYGAGQETRVVNISQGQVRGYIANDYDVFQFFNIPYATTPRGQDKFKAPLAPSLWFGVFDAVDRRIICPQIINSTLLNQQEDCLVANIHVPNTNETNLPVLVFVNGIAYLSGHGLADIPNGLASSKNIIVVTFNYRLGVHGFLCLGTADAPGNAGMRDQVALLRWVQNNIRNFGGNPNDVTISGCSAGGSSVDLLMLSGMTNGLFSKVIAESGCSINTFATQLDPLQNARSHALNLGFTNVTNLDALSDFYTRTEIGDLLDPSMLAAKDSYFLFQPCVETNIGQQRFLTDSPINILNSGNFRKLPLIYGYSKHEGMFRLPEFNEWSIAMNENFSEFLPADLQFVNETQKMEVAAMVKEFYFGNKTIDNNSISEYIDYFTDVFVLGGILRSITLRVRAGHNEVYLYEYSFTHNGSLTFPNTTGIRGATHCDQFAIILDHPQPETLTEERINMAVTMRDIISNFITTGNPNGVNSTLPIWLPVDVNRSPFYSIGTTIQVGDIPIESRALFWDKIYELYGSMPPPPEIVPTTTEIPSETTETYESTTEEEGTTTPESDAATLINPLSYQFWILYSVFIFIFLK